MKKEALDAASRVLERKNPSPGEVEEAMRAIGTFAPRMAPWKPRIEALIARLSKKIRHQIRESFLIHFASVGDHARAAEFIHAPRTLSPAGIFLAVESLLRLGRHRPMQKACSDGSR